MLSKAHADAGWATGGRAGWPGCSGQYQNMEQLQVLRYCQSQVQRPVQDYAQGTDVCS